MRPRTKAIKLDTIPFWEK